MDKTYLSAAEMAKQFVRPALKARFPGVKFSVVSDSYAGGASIRVSWVDGPVEREVEAVVDQFAGSDFDGMQDLKVGRAPFTAEDGRQIRSLADFIFTRREFSPEFYLQAAQDVCKRYGLPVPTREDLHIWTHGKVETCGGIKGADLWVRDRGEHKSTLIYRELATRDGRKASATVAE